MGSSQGLEHPLKFVQIKGGTSSPTIFRNM